MTGLHLAVLIAEGKTTLADAIRSTPPEEGSNEIYTSTSVDCVDSTVVSLAMQTNDSFDESTRGWRARKAWALKTLPRLLGTRGNHRLVAKLDEKFSKEYEEQKVRRLAQAFLDSKEYNPNLLDEAHIAAFCMDNDEEGSVEYRIAKLDYVLTGIGH